MKGGGGWFETDHEQFQFKLSSQIQRITMILCRGLVGLSRRSRASICDNGRGSACFFAIFPSRMPIFKPLQVINSEIIAIGIFRILQIRPEAILGIGKRIFGLLMEYPGVETSWSRAQSSLANISWCPNVLGPKCPRAQMSWCPSFLGPKCPGAQMSRAQTSRAHFSGAQMSWGSNVRGPNV